MPARSCLSKALGCSLLLLVCLSCCCRALAAATATLTVSGTENQLASGWGQGNLTVAFNGFSETVHYAEFSSSASLASALAGMFSRDYIGSGLCAHASGAAVTFHLQGTATFGQLAIAGPTTSFQLTGSGWSSQTAVADSGTITLTVNGVTAATTQYGAGATPASIASGLASGVTAGSPVNVSAEGDSINLQAKQTGSTTDYSYSLQTSSYDSTDFSQPSFLNPAAGGSLSGGANQNSSGGPVYSYSVPAGGYDGEGNLQGMTDSVIGAWTYQYDNLNRVELATDTQPNNPYTNYCWSYDLFGNRTNQEGATAAFASGSGGYNACTPASEATVQTAWATYYTDNQIEASSQTPAGPSYDLAGNITYDGVNSYRYDAEGRMCAESSTPMPGVTSMTGYVYNAEGERVGKGQITSWSCDPSTNGYKPMNDYVLGLSGEELTELTANSSGSMVWKNTNVYADGQLFATYDTTGLHFLLNDPLGTRRAQTNYAGVLEQTCASLPFGDQLACSDSIETPNTLHYTGKERDTESGLDYFGARYYASSMGRFMSPDAPVDQHPENPQSWNLYTYVRNNPLRNTDPTGNYDCGQLSSAQCFQVGYDLAAGQNQLTNAHLNGDITDSQFNQGSAAISSYGNMNDHNGVTVNVGDNGGFPGVTTATNGAPITGANPTGQNIQVTFQTGLLENANTNGVIGTVAHEGSHVGDAEAWASAGYTDAANPTHFDTEFRAYGVTSIFGAAQGASALSGTSPRGGGPHLFWEKMFPDVVNNALRTNMIKTLYPGWEQKAFQANTNSEAK
jgi:RHS repeat-associated protein